MRNLLLTSALLAGIIGTAVAPNAFADQHDPSLPKLFQFLKTTSSPDEAGALEDKIWSLWAETGDPALTHVFPSAEVLRDAKIDGMPASRAETIRRIAHGSLDVKGIGPWTRSYIAMRRGDPDAFPETDLVLRKAMADVGKRAEAWRPWRAYAAILLWRNS